LVVRISEGRDAIQAYVAAQTGQGLPYVLDLLTEDNNRVLALIGDLTEVEGMTVTPVDEWRVFDALRHMTAGLDRSRERIGTLSSGRQFVPPPGVAGGGMGTRDFASFSDLRRAYIDGMAEVLALLRHADPQQGLDLTADHAAFGPFNWLGWAIFSHHVHTHDHIGQIENIRKALRTA
jgi:hypothetical protein